MQAGVPGMADQRAILAAKHGDLAALEQLHANGALGWDIADSSGAGLVHHASRAGSLECLKFLVLQAKLPGNQRANNGATPAHDAAAMGNLAELQWLIRDGGYNLQERDASGASPLHVAARFGHAEVVQWLLQAGYDTAMETCEGAVPAHYAAARGDLTCLKLLVAADHSCVNKQTQSGCSPLYLACQEGHLHIAQFLVKDCVANVHLSAHDGMSVLHTAAWGGHYPLVVWLAAFTDINLTAQDEEGATALHFAARGGHAAIVDRLLLMGAVIMRDHWGGTPLHDAAENGQLECCWNLVSHGIDPGLRDEDGYTAMDLAEYNGHRQCAQYLQEVEKLSGQQRDSSNQEGQKANVTVTKSQCMGEYHRLHDHLDCLGTSSDATTRMENAKTQAPMNSLQLEVSDSPHPKKEGIIHTHPSNTTANSFDMVLPTESSKPLTAELKISKSLQKARITAMFTHAAEKKEPTDPAWNSFTFPVLDELHPLDIDALVPTHDERGHPIPEWKRQVMVRKLQARLQSEEDVGRKSTEDGSAELRDWRYSHTHNAILGPYGELLTEDDVLYLERQIENLQLRKKCQEYESELGRLAEELQTILPAPIVNITINSQLLQQGPERGDQTLPVWCSRISGVVKSMSLLLANVNDGKRKEGERPAPKTQSKPSEVRGPAGGTAEREILECGVSVRDLRGNFEKQAFPGQKMPLELQGGKGTPRECSGGYLGPSQKPWSTSKSQRKPVCEDHECGDVEIASDSGISCEEASSDASGSPVPATEAVSLRKERIVMLFLSHWKKSAYMPSLKTMARKTLEAQRGRRKGGEEASGKAREERVPVEKPVVEMSKLSHLIQQRNTIKNLICNWKDLISHVPSRQIQRLNRRHITYSPEQFLPHVNGAPVDYDSLTLDLFMLGYFHILELDLSPDERRARHLLCFEVFDHLGRHSWETVRAFHKAVVDEVTAGRRGWKDSLEDVKIHFFGHAKDPKREMEPSRASADTTLKPISRVKVQSAALEQGQHVPGNCTELGSFNNEEICRYIDRSFTFWKEKEAEIFSFED
ncbi:espin-like protein isoform X1 [Alligator sinensis]|uniref:Espin-like protein isoform X1 n=2 Tax=Alligator sinensis TaxID=38654 RepID=A0A3Q0GZ02_ALLSI|nr:espin-like protein isoform X1 [Alligator sinensis]